jgi:hypothetical protein
MEEEWMRDRALLRDLLQKIPHASPQELASAGSLFSLCRAKTQGTRRNLLCIQRSRLIGSSSPRASYFSLWL